MNKYKAEFPHCDSCVLHAPGSCIYCDEYPEKQNERIKNNINFTGENNSTKETCPAEVKRSINVINRWHGNLPITKEDQYE